MQEAFKGLPALRAGPGGGASRRLVDVLSALDTDSAEAPPPGPVMPLAASLRGPLVLEDLEAKATNEEKEAPASEEESTPGEPTPEESSVKEATPGEEAKEDIPPPPSQEQPPAEVPEPTAGVADEPAGEGKADDDDTDGKPDDESTDGKPDDDDTNGTAGDNEADGKADDPPPKEDEQREADKPSPFTFTPSVQPKSAIAAALMSGQPLLKPDDPAEKVVRKISADGNDVELTTLEYTPTLLDNPGDNARRPRFVRRGRKPRMAIVVPITPEDTAASLQRTLEGIAAGVDEVMVMQNRAIKNERLLASAGENPLLKTHLNGGAEPSRVAQLNGLPSRAVLDATEAFAASDFMWHDFMVTLVVDGVDAVSPALLHHLGTLGLFDRSLMVSGSGDSDTETRPQAAAADDCLSPNTRTLLDGVGVVHLFERAVMLPSVFLDKLHRMPLQVTVGVKEHAGGVMNSFWWFYFALAKQMRLEYVCHARCGVGMRPDTLPALIRDLLKDKAAGAAYPRQRLRLRPHRVLQSAQAFHNTLNTVLHKFTESATGHVHSPSTDLALYRYDSIVGLPLMRFLRLEQESVWALDSCGVVAAKAASTTLNQELIMRSYSESLTHFVPDAVVDGHVPRDLAGIVERSSNDVRNKLLAPLSFFTLIMTRKPAPVHHPGRQLLWMFTSGVSTLWSVVLWFSVAVTYLVTAEVFSVFIPGDWERRHLFDYPYAGLLLLQVLCSVCAPPRQRPRPFPAINLLSKKAPGRAPKPGKLKPQPGFGVDTSKMPYTTLWAALRRQGFVDADDGEVARVTVAERGRLWKPRQLCAPIMWLGGLAFGLCGIGAVGGTVYYVYTGEIEAENVFPFAYVFALWLMSATLHCQAHTLLLTGVQFLAFVPVYVNIVLVHAFAAMGDAANAMQPGSLANTERLLEAAAKRRKRDGPDTAVQRRAEVWAPRPGREVGFGGRAQTVLQARLSITPAGATPAMRKLTASRVSDGQASTRSADGLLASARSSNRAPWPSVVPVKAVRPPVVPARVGAARRRRCYMRCFRNTALLMWLGSNAAGAWAAVTYDVVPTVLTCTAFAVMGLTTWHFAAALAERLRAVYRNCFASVPEPHMPDSPSEKAARNQRALANVLADRYQLQFAGEVFDGGVAGDSTTPLASYGRRWSGSLSHSGSKASLGRSSSKRVSRVAPDGSRSNRRRDSPGSQHPLSPKVTPPRKTKQIMSPLGLGRQVSTGSRGSLGSRHSRKRAGSPRRPSPGRPPRDVPRPSRSSNGPTSPKRPSRSSKANRKEPQANTTPAMPAVASMPSLQAPPMVMAASPTMWGSPSPGGMGWGPAMPQSPAGMGWGVPQQGWGYPPYGYVPSPMPWAQPPADQRPPSQTPPPGWGGFPAPYFVPPQQFWGPPGTAGSDHSVSSASTGAGDVGSAVAPTRPVPQVAPAVDPAAAMMGPAPQVPPPVGEQPTLAVDPVAAMMEEASGGGEEKGASTPRKAAHA